RCHAVPPEILALPPLARYAAMAPSNLRRPEVDDFRAFSVRMRNPCSGRVRLDRPSAARVESRRRRAPPLSEPCEARKGTHEATAEHRPRPAMPHLGRFFCLPDGRGVIKAQVLDEAALERALTRIGHEILER